MWEMRIFFAAGWDSPPFYRVFHKIVGFGEVVMQSIQGRGNKQDESRWEIFGKMGNTGGIIQGYNSAGHCFLSKSC